MERYKRPKIDATNKKIGTTREEFDRTEKQQEGKNMRVTPDVQRFIPNIVTRDADFDALPEAEQERYITAAFYGPAVELYHLDRRAREEADARAAIQAKHDADAAAKIKASIMFLNGLDLTKTADQIKAAMQLGVALAFQDANGNPSVYTASNDVAKNIETAKRQDIQNFLWQLPRGDGGRVGIVAVCASDEVLESLSAKRGLPPTLIVRDPATGLNARLYSHAFSTQRLEFASPTCRVTWAIRITPTTTFGPIVTDEATGTLPRLPKIVDGWLRSCGEGDVRPFFDLMNS